MFLARSASLRGRARRSRQCHGAARSVGGIGSGASVTTEGRRHSESEASVARGGRCGRCAFRHRARALSTRTRGPYSVRPWSCCWDKHPCWIQAAESAPPSPAPARATVGGAPLEFSSPAKPLCLLREEIRAGGRSLSPLRQHDNASPSPPIRPSKPLAINPDPPVAHAGEA